MARRTPAQFAARIPDRVSQVKRYMAFDLWNRVTRGNPVDTGRSRAAWNLSVGAADLAVPDKPPKSTTLAPPSLPTLGEIPAGVPVVLSNNLPYVPELEKGSSKQAPDGFVQRSIDEVKGVFGDIVTQVRRLDEARP